jgi:hypothetical protein
MIAQLDRDVELSLEGIREVIEEEFDKLSEKEGVPHYTKDGKEWTGPTHKMPNGKLMTQSPHNDDSEELFHKEDLKEAIKLSKKQSRDLKIKINNARTIGKYFTKEEVTFLQSLFENKLTEISKEEKAAQFKLKLFLKKGLKLSVKDGEDKLYKYAMELDRLADDEYDEVVDPIMMAVELVQDAGEPGKNNVVKDKEYYSYIKSADKHMKTFVKNAKKAIGSMKEGKLTEATSIWKQLDAKWKLQDEVMDLEYDMKMITKDLSQLHKDMEQEAEPGGGKIADRYGRDIEKKEKEYKKKKAEFKKLMAKLDKLEQF